MHNHARTPRVGSYGGRLAAIFPLALTGGDEDGRFLFLYLQAVKSFRLCVCSSPPFSAQRVFLPPRLVSPLAVHPQTDNESTALAGSPVRRLPLREKNGRIKVSSRAVAFVWFLLSPLMLNRTLIEQSGASDLMGDPPKSVEGGPWTLHDTLIQLNGAKSSVQLKQDAVVCP